MFFCACYNSRVRLNSLLLLALLLGATPALAQKLPTTAANKDTLAELGIGMELETLVGGFVIAAPSTTMLGENKTDPHYGIKLSRQIGVYAPTSSGELHQVVSVHHESGDRGRALQIARLAARLLRLHKDHVGQEATFPQGEELADVWLSRVPAVNGEKIAGETRINNVYFYQVTEERSPILWARVVAHEWGHLTLPAARGYQEPEGDAAGFLGERLYLKWLHEDLTALPRKLDDFCEPEGVKLYYTRQVEPLIARFSGGGPADKRLDLKTTEGMDYYIGMALAADQAFGSKVAGFALYHTESVAPRALVTAIQNGVFLQPELSVKLPAWVPFAPDTYTVHGSAGKVSIDVRTVDPAKPLPFVIQKPGYKLVKGSVPTVTLRRGVPKK